MKIKPNACEDNDRLALNSGPGLPIKFRMQAKQPQKGGTKMWCPQCRAITVCSALPPYESDILGRGQRKQTSPKAKAGIHWFERRRECQTCGDDFTTVEIHEDFLYELFQSRNAMQKIRETADALIKWRPE